MRCEAACISKWPGEPERRCSNRAQHLVKGHNLCGIHKNLVERWRSFPSWILFQGVTNELCQEAK